MKYLIDYDTRLSEDKQTLDFLRNKTVFETITGDQANETFKKLVKIHDLKGVGFEYREFSFDGQLEEWYERVLREPTHESEGITVVYSPVKDLFEIAESGIVLADIQKVDDLIRSMK